MARITVIMSVYNAEEYLAESLTSILNQTYQDFLVRIVDDCSTDRSGTILNDFAARDGRIILSANSVNIGMTKSINRLLKDIDSDYVARMDADDISEPTRLEEQLIFLDKNTDIDIVGTYAVDIDHAGTEIQERTVPLQHSDIVRMLLKLSPIVHPSVMFRKRAIESVHGYDERYRTSQDIDLWFRCLRGGLRFANIPRTLLRYRSSVNFNKRKSVVFRLNDFVIRYRGFRMLRVPWYKWYLLGIPLILMMLPRPVYLFMKKMDPR